MGVFRNHDFGRPLATSFDASLHEPVGRLIPIERNPEGRIDLGGGAFDIDSPPVTVARNDVEAFGLQVVDDRLRILFRPSVGLKKLIDG